MAVELPSEYVEFLSTRDTGLTKMDDRLDYMVILLTQIRDGLASGESGSGGSLKEAIELLSGSVLRLAQLVSKDPELVLNNPPFIRTQIKRVTSAGTAVRLPDVKIPNGFYVSIKALRSNWFTVYIAPSKADAESHTTAYALAPGEAIDLQISTLENIWVDADSSGEGLTWIIEQEASY